jgi:hypothetical protein
MKLNRTTKFDSLPANVKGPAKAAGATAAKAAGAAAAGAAAGGASGASKVDADSLQLSAVAGQVSTNDAPQVSLGADMPLPKTEHLNALRAAATVLPPAARAAATITLLATEIANRMFDKAQ